ncbi:MAG: N-acetyltransferase family protein [Gaiellaceae bacterium]
MARVHVSSWRAAYRGLLPEDYLAALTVEGRTRRWRRRLRELRSGETVLLAERDGQAVGFASAGPSRDSDCDWRRVGELYAIYALEGEWGRGTGRLLHDEAVRALEALGFREAILWVLDTNERARSFYERRGWAPDGSEKHEHYGKRVRELRYRRGTLAS